MNKIKELRIENGWKPEELGQLLRVKSAAVSKYENGHIPLTDETIHKLCEIFGVSADYIIGRTEQRNTTIISQEVRAITDACADINSEDLKKVMECIDFLKSKH